VSRDKINFVEKRKAEEARRQGQEEKKQEYCTIYYPVARGRNKRKGPN
jgi:hypothetical protein